MLQPNTSNSKAWERPNKPKAQPIKRNITKENADYNEIVERNNLRT